MQAALHTLQQPGLEKRCDWIAEPLTQAEVPEEGTRQRASPLDRFRECRDRS